MNTLAKFQPEAPSATLAPSTAPRAAGAHERALFGALCFVWGTTWLAMKVGIATVPPGFFAGTRWTVAGLALLLVRALGGHTLDVPFRLRARLVLCSVLMVSLNQVVQLYGLRHITAGLAAVLSSALTPIGLLGFAVALRQEPFRWRQVGAVGLGVAGILALFGPKALKGELDWMEVLGALAVVVSTLSYAYGSVLARPLMRTMPPAHVAAMTNFIGGGLLLGFALAFEPGALKATTGDWGLPAFLAWLYLLLPGSLGATVIYFLLVRDWGASRAGTYAFISPVIAVAIGFVFFGEHVEASDILGMVLMLAAAGMVLRVRR
ncbi:MAG: EamA family transporter [Acetobacteraceae bacterium]|nr:EamA family transporter [Acetobacteraceae bacterium]